MLEKKKELRETVIFKCGRIRLTVNINIVDNGELISSIPHGHMMTPVDNITEQIGILEGLIDFKLTDLEKDQIKSTSELYWTDESKQNYINSKQEKSA